MYWLDFILLIILAIGVFLGARRGLLWQVARVVTFGVAIYACINYHDIAANWLLRNVTGLSAAVTWFLAYVVTFLAVCFVGYLLTMLLEKALRAAKLKPMDRLLGAVAGLVTAGLLAGGVLTGLALYATPASDDMLGESKVAPVLLKGMRVVLVAVPQKYKDDLSRTLDRVQKQGAEAIKEKATEKPEKKPFDPNNFDALNDPLD